MTVQLLIGHFVSHDVCSRNTGMKNRLSYLSYSGLVLFESQPFGMNKRIQSQMINASHDYTKTIIC